MPADLKLSDRQPRNSFRWRNSPGAREIRRRSRPLDNVCLPRYEAAYARRHTAHGCREEDGSVLGMTFRERPDLDGGRMPSRHFLFDEPGSEEGSKLPCYALRQVQCLARRQNGLCHSPISGLNNGKPRSFSCAWRIVRSSGEVSSTSVAFLMMVAVIQLERLSSQMNRYEVASRPV